MRSECLMYHKENTENALTEKINQWTSDSEELIKLVKNLMKDWKSQPIQSKFTEISQLQECMIL